MTRNGALTPIRTRSRGGMAQRVLIAMALSSRPRLLIADEPTTGLDVTIQAQFLDEMWEATQATGSAVLLVTQDLGIVANYCDRVAVMADGAIVESAPVREFFRAPRTSTQEGSFRCSAPHKAMTCDRTAARSADVPAGERRSSRCANLSKDFDIRGSNAKVHAVDQAFVRHPPARDASALSAKAARARRRSAAACCGWRRRPAGEIQFGATPLHAISDERTAFRPHQAADRLQDPFDSMNPRWSVAEIIGEMLDLHTSLRGAEKDGARSTSCSRWWGSTPRSRMPRRAS